MHFMQKKAPYTKDSTLTRVPYIHLFWRLVNQQHRIMLPLKFRGANSCIPWWQKVTIFYLCLDSSKEPYSQTNTNAQPWACTSSTLPITSSTTCKIPEEESWVNIIAREQLDEKYSISCEGFRTMRQSQLALIWSEQMPPSSSLGGCSILSTHGSGW